MKLLPAFALATLLGGCAVAEAIDKMERQEDQAACDGFGFRRGTDAYANCMMQQSAQREAEDQAAMDRAAWQNSQQQRRNRSN